MSSRELLALLADLPETAAFRQRAERDLVLAEVDGELRLYSALARVPVGARVEEAFTDWTDTEKRQARIAQELACSRADYRGYTPDLTGLEEPLAVALRNRETRIKRENRAGASSAIKSALYAYQQQEGEQ